MTKYFLLIKAPKEAFQKPHLTFASESHVILHAMFSEASRPLSYHLPTAPWCQGDPLVYLDLSYSRVESVPNLHLHYWDRAVLTQGFPNEQHWEMIRLTLRSAGLLVKSPKIRHWITQKHNSTTNSLNIHIWGKVLLVIMWGVCLGCEQRTSTDIF